MENEKDLSVFDKSVMDLMSLSKKILNAAEKRKLASEKKNPFLFSLEKYERTYNKTEPNEHIGYFRTIYNKNKKQILLGPQRDAWLIDNQVSITYGEDCGLKTDVSLYLSAIYRTSSRMRDEVKEELEGLPTGTEDTAEIIYPRRYLLHLYRIFQEVVESDNERNKLSTHISNLENEIGIGGNEKGTNDPLSSMFDMAATMAEQATGQKIPRDKMPGKNDFGKMLGQIVNNPQTKSLLGNMMQKFQNTENIGDVVTTLVDSLGAVNRTEGTGNVAPNASAGENLAVESKGVNDVNDEFADFE